MVPRSMQMGRFGPDGAKARLGQSQKVEIGRNTKDRQRFGSKEFLTEKGRSETEIGRDLDQKSSCKRKMSRSESDQKSSPGPSPGQQKSHQNRSWSPPWGSWGLEDVPRHARGRPRALPGPARDCQDRPFWDQLGIKN